MHKPIIDTFLRYLPEGSSQADFTLAEAIVAQYPEAANPFHRPISVWQEKGLLVGFMAVGTADAVVGFRLWGMTDGESESKPVKPWGTTLTCLGVGTFTLGTQTGPAPSAVVRSTERIADAISFALTTEATTPKGPGSIIAAALGDGDPQVYSPGGDTRALLVLPTLFRAENLIIEFDLPASGVTLANAFFQKFRV